MLKFAEAMGSARERREYERIATQLPEADSILADPEISTCLVSDFSAGGARLKYFGSPARPNLIAALAIKGFGTFDGITMRDHGTDYGMRFLFGESDRTI
jgi:hypothetical protein